MRVLVLVSDAYGGHGGIATYNRDVLRALCEDPAITEVVALPRVASFAVTSLPESLEFDMSATTGTTAYLRSMLKHLRERRFDLVYCAHVNLSPLAWLASIWSRCPWILAIYGVEAWRPKSRWSVRYCSRRANHINSISRITLERFLEFSTIPIAQTSIVPNAVHLEQFGMAPRNEVLANKLGLIGRKVLMTFGRLAKEERYKGFDEVISVLPRLVAQVPEIIYVIAGTGPDQGRLSARVKELGLSEYVRFTGYVEEEEKGDLYRLADAFALASKGEGFGFVLLEAMACGIPVIASRIDGGREAVRDGLLGRLVNPDDPDELFQAILEGLKTPKRIPDGLEHFAFANFSKRLLSTIWSVASCFGKPRSS